MSSRERSPEKSIRWPFPRRVLPTLLQSGAARCLSYTAQRPPFSAPGPSPDEIAVFSQLHHEPTIWFRYRSLPLDEPDALLDAPAVPPHQIPTDDARAPADALYAVHQHLCMRTGFQGSVDESGARRKDGGEFRKGEVVERDLSMGDVWHRAEVDEASHDG
jgi:hypothetical protein